MQQQFSTNYTKSVNLTKIRFRNVATSSRTTTTILEKKISWKHHKMVIYNRWFHAIFAKVTFFLTKLLKNWFHEIYFCDDSEILSHWKYFSWNQFFSNFFSKNVHSSCVVEKREILLPRKFFSSNQFRVKFFSKSLIWRKICEKNCGMAYGNKIP